MNRQTLVILSDCLRIRSGPDATASYTHSAPNAAVARRISEDAFKERLAVRGARLHRQKTHGQGTVGQQGHLLKVAAFSQCALKRPAQQAAQPHSPELQNSYRLQ